METRLIPVLDASGLRSYLEVPGNTYFEAAYNVNSLLSGAVTLDMDLLDLTEQEFDVLHKQNECKLIREQLHEVSYKKIDALANNRSPRKFLNEQNELSFRLFRLEREIKKACP
ncbi:hypothetical protein UY286_08775 [Paenibacillus polymyxa]|uniref:hypothetical protein n=1 Tax=Paenibacillus polymyxa TaxID=1406 RepID=UPI002AB3BA5C|nr:hypothetical protein [Paenibacillus polymyxa]MDY7990658.1 hypothetical protein [Paenibacillus polymyxa]MDY8117532.1 hypothetical protein [Paenibacillus polymyxa]